MIVSGDLVFTAGQDPFDASGQLVSDDFSEQAHQVFRNLRLCLQSAGCDLRDVLKVTTYLMDFEENFPAYNDIYRQYFDEPYPARTTVEAGLNGFKIEVEAIVRRP